LHLFRLFWARVGARHPGARQAGISHFIDQQISIPPEEALLEARILNVRPPYANFYRAALGAVVYLILRSDAVDVVYGTMDGYANLGIPYMPHIAPSKRW
jgi:hypothetical protein